MNSPLEYMQRAKELGMPAMAITDHGVLTGHREFQRAALETGVKPILGLESYITNDPSVKIPQKERAPDDYVYNHITILAKNEVGLETLGRLSERAYTHGYYNKPRIGKTDLFMDHEGLIILSGCMSGIIAKDIEREDYAEAYRHACEWQEAFGDDFFIEIMSSNEPGLNNALLSVADKAGIKPVMTQDSHYAYKEDLWVEEAMLILASNPKVRSGYSFEESRKGDVLERFNYLYPDRFMTFEKIEIYVRDYQTEVQKFAAQGITRTDIYENTLDIADSVEAYEYPQGIDLLPVEHGPGAFNLLSGKVTQGLKTRGLENNVEALRRASEELTTIHAMGFDEYFLIVADSVEEAKRLGIRMSPGRGSAVASICCYAMGITEINPLDYGLLFWRFLDPSRSDFPDVDLDFQASRRYEIKDYMRRRYEHVASIATYGYFTEKGVIKDAARVFKIPLGETNKMMKTISTFEEFFVSPSTFEYRNKYPEVGALAKRLRGRIRQTGVHAGGIVLSKEPINKYAPMMTMTDPDNKNGPRISVVGYDMNEVADVGLIKFDFLGLKGLDVVEECIKLIKERSGLDLDPNKLPLDCSEVYDMLSAGNTKALFQVNKPAYTQLLKEMGGVSNFMELAASNALVRPGASKSTIGKDYIKGKETGKYTVVDECVRYFTEETYGVCIFQEQQMLLCIELAGMSMEQANKVRKAVSKKIPEDLDKWKDVFIEGASQKVSKSKAEKAWKDLKASEDYAFGKGHSIAYSLLTYQMAYLKYFYPIEFMTAALRAEDKDKDARLGLLMEAKRMGLRIVLPHVNESGLTFTIQSDDRGDFIRMGITDVKYVGNAVGKKIIDARPFNNYKELEDISSEKYSGINVRVLESLNKVGSAVFEDNPLRGDERDNFFEYLAIPAFEVKQLSDKAKALITPLEDYNPEDTFVCMGMVTKIKRGPGWARADVVDETGSCGIFMDEKSLIAEGNFYVFLVSSNSIIKYVTLNDLADGQGGAIRDWLERDSFDDIPNSQYQVIAFKSRKTKAGKNMANVVFTDNDANLKGAVVFDRDFINIYTRCKESAVVGVEFGKTSSGSTVINNIY